ncbi:conserved hypothetical protein [Burkholderia cenocepacia]|nr:conserved hypothetical protein [Burkholderia cenocepacia]
MRDLSQPVCQVATPVFNDSTPVTTRGHRVAGVADRIRANRVGDS